MKLSDTKFIRHITVLAVLITSFYSCEYKEVADADYPDQIIYIPAANYNPYLINVVPERRGESPTPGYPVRFTVDNTANKFNVLLGVYRAGINEKGSFMVNISVNTDTIAPLITSGVLPADTEVLPSDKYTLVPLITVKDGQELGKFDLVVDRDFLRTGYPDKKYAIGVRITSADRKVNENLSMVIVMVDTRIMKPTAGFTFAAASGNANQINFTNTSTNGVDYSWNFGDGSAVSTDKNTSHTYLASGTYNVTLTVVGITGEVDKAETTNAVNIP